MGQDNWLREEKNRSPHWKSDAERGVESAAIPHFHLFADVVEIGEL